MHKVDMDAEMKVSGSENGDDCQDQRNLKQGGRRALRFPEALETAFNVYHLTNTLKHVRVALLTGLVPCPA
jgi:hypothetical protein